MPRRVRGDLSHERIVKIVCSDYHNAAISEGGELWVWGCAVYGKLGFMLAPLLETLRLGFTGMGVADLTFGALGATENIGVKGVCQ